MKDKTTSKIFNLIKHALKPHRMKMVFIFIANIATSLIILTIPLFLKEITEILKGAQPNMQEINSLVLLLGLVLIAQALFSFIGEYYTERVGEQITLELREYFFTRILMLPMTSLREYSSGELTARLTDDVKAVRRVVTESSVQIIKNSLMIIAIIILLITINPLITLVIFCSVIFIGIGSTFMLNSIKRISVNIQGSHSKLLSSANEALNNIPIIKAFVREDYISDMYKRKSNETLKLIIRRTKMIAFVRPLSNLIAFGAIAISFWFAIGRVATGAIAASELIAYFGYAFILASSVSILTSNLGILKKETGTIHELLEFTSEGDVPSKTSTKPLTTKRLKGSIEFVNVNFSYRNNNHVLSNLNFKIEDGSTIAIIGPSGVGKSTIINMLLKKIEPQNGEVLIDGIPLQSIETETLRKNIGVVLQNPYLFNMSISENILFGNPEATLDEVISVAKAVNIDSFIQKLPKKYDTSIGEMGNKLSRGQSQRIAIARMLLKDPPIVVLDEATASLDNQNERLVYSSVKNMLEDRTTIIISHKLNSLTDVDKIFFLSNGQIIEEGSHDELIQSNGIYYEMYHNPEEKIMT